MVTRVYKAINWGYPSFRHFTSAKSFSFSMYTLAFFSDMNPLLHVWDIPGNMVVDFVPRSDTIQ